MSLDLKRFPLFVEFSQDDRQALEALLEEQSLVRGRSAFREGSEADGLVLVVSGGLELKSRRGGSLGVVGPGAALGALSLVAVGPRESTALAEGPCEILRLRRSAFRRLVEDAPRTACRLVEAIASDVAALLRPELERCVEELGSSADPA